MFSDVLIIIFSVAACLNGWHRGLSRSLRGLMALVAAAFLTPYAYPRLAPWVYSKLDVDPAQATVIAYLACFFVITTLVTAMLVQLFNSYWENNPWLVDRFGGFLYGGVKATCIVILATAISQDPIQFPAPLTTRMGLAKVAEGSQYFMPFALPYAQRLTESQFGKRYILARH